MNLCTEERSVECPWCANYLQCYGYMISGNINCRYCEKSFTLTEEIWSKSYLKIVMNACYPCGVQKKHGITKHDFDKKQIHLVCLSCKNTFTVNY